MTDLRIFDFHPARKDMLADVLNGLTAEEKWISSMYFYDERGSQLFDAVCELPEYYPTRTELSIMEDNISDIVAMLGERVALVEFGSGSAVKIRILLRHLNEPVAYIPVEIAREHLMNSAAELQRDFPAIEILAVCADFTQDFALPQPERAPRRTIVYFPGSTIGNFDPEDARELMRRMAKVAGRGGGVLLGVDLEKDRETVELAYNDPAGVTAEFNLNVLRRINGELGANFDLDAFHHKAIWNPARYRIEMHLVSEREQTVNIRGTEIRFAAGETIHTESSYKYTLERFAKLAASAGLRVEKVWTDARQMFSVQYLSVID